jgi:hypothetical protein
VGRVKLYSSRGINSVTIGAEERASADKVMGEGKVVTHIAFDRIGLVGEAEKTAVGAGGSKGSAVGESESEGG